MDGRQMWQSMKGAGAVWEHPEDPRAPHVVLRSGKHSDGFIDTLQFLSQVNYLELAAQVLAEKLRKRTKMKIDWVFGSPMAGIPFATVLARHVGAKRIGFNEKTGGGDGKDLICRFDLQSWETFLVVEEMTTSGGTPARGIEAVLKKNPRATALDLVGACLTRCGAKSPELPGREIVSLVSLPELGIRYNEWEAGSCPLCKAGSRAITDCKRVWPDLLRTMREPTHQVP